MLKIALFDCANANTQGSAGGGGGWAQVELTDALSRINRCKKFTLFRPF